MKLQHIFEQLASGELAQISLGGGQAGDVPEAAHLMLTKNVQLGLTALYKRFNLKEGRSSANLVSTQTDYPIVVESLLKIEQVLLDSGFALPLNDSSSVDSCFTPNSKLLRVPKHIVEQGPGLADVLRSTKLTLVYRDNHPKIDTALAPETVELELPDAFEHVLLLFVASRIHTPSGIMGNMFSMGNNYYQRFEIECKRLEDEGLEVDTTAQTNRLQAKGFV